MAHQTSSSPRFVPTEQCISKAFIVIVFVPIFPGEISFPSRAQAVHLLLQLCALSVTGHRKSSRGIWWGKVERTTFLGDPHCSDIGIIHPSPTQIHHFEVSGAPCWLKGTLLVVLMEVDRISEPSGWDGESQRQPLSSVQ